MKYLKKEGFQTVTYREIESWLYDGDELPERAMAIDFDDNRLNVMGNACPVLDVLGFVATGFVITDLASGKTCREWLFILLSIGSKFLPFHSN